MVTNLDLSILKKIFHTRPEKYHLLMKNSRSSSGLAVASLWNFSSSKLVLSSWFWRECSKKRWLYYIWRKSLKIKIEKFFFFLKMVIPTFQLQYLVCLWYPANEELVKSFSMKNMETGGISSTIFWQFYVVWGTPKIGCIWVLHQCIS